MADHPTSTPPTAPGGSVPPTASGVPAPPPDDENPAIIFAKKTYMWTLVFAVGFIGAVVLFIL